jgi:acyl-coenzyme A thioesterase PaaI-like protein
MSAPLLSKDQVAAFLKDHFPQIGPGRDFLLEDVGPMTARLRLVASAGHLRPGGTISGPAMFALADVAIYVTILAQLGVGNDPANAHLSPGSLAVTTNLSINFLRKPAQRDLIGEARLMKLGKRLAVGEALLHSDGEDEPVAHAVATYSIPPA